MDQQRQEQGEKGKGKGGQKGGPWKGKVEEKCGLGEVMQMLAGSLGAGPGNEQPAWSNTGWLFHVEVSNRFARASCRPPPVRVAAHLQRLEDGHAEYDFSDVLWDLEYYSAMFSYNTGAFTNAGNLLFS